VNYGWRFISAFGKKSLPVLPSQILSLLPENTLQLEYYHNLHNVTNTEDSILTAVHSGEPVIV
jgi:hypothetical protein